MKARARDGVRYAALPVEPAIDLGAAVLALAEHLGTGTMATEDEQLVLSLQASIDAGEVRPVTDHEIKTINALHAAHFV